MAFLKQGRLFTPRTELTFPGLMKGNDPLKAYKSFLKSAADHGMADMEDACPHEFKGGPVRKAIVQAFNELDFSSKVITFRPNNWQTDWHLEDLESVITQAVNKFDGIILPKIFEAKNLEYSLSIIKRSAEKSGWGYLPQVEILIENPTALTNIKELCEVGAKEFTQKDGRGMLVGLIFGIADYAAANSQPDALYDQNKNFLVAKQTVINTAHAYGLHAVDNVWLKLNPKKPVKEEWLNQMKQTGDALLKSKLPIVDESGDSVFETDVYQPWEAEKAANEKAQYEKNREVARWGMDATWVMHPGQIELANKAFTPTKEQVKRAEALVEEYFAAGGGSLVSKAGGSVAMADTATMNIALTQLRRASQAKDEKGEILYDPAKVDAFDRKVKEVIGFSYH